MRNLGFKEKIVKVLESIPQCTFSAVRPQFKEPAGLSRLRGSGQGLAYPREEVYPSALKCLFHRRQRPQAKLIARLWSCSC